MNLSKISVRYAKAIFLLAKENDVLTKVYSDFQLISETINITPEFKHLISSPVITPVEKKKVLDSAFGKYVHEMTNRFFVLLIDKHREDYLLDIARNFESLYRKEFNIKQVVVTTQLDISSAIREKISAIVKDLYKSEVEIKNNTKDDMIGGIIIRIENHQLDLSVKTQLKEIKKNLKSKSYQKGI